MTPGSPFLVFVCFLLAVVSTVDAQHWEIKEFDVVRVEPSGDHEFNVLNSIGARIHRAIGLGDPDFLRDELAHLFQPHPEVKRQMERYLHDAAVQLEAWGFPPPALEPVVTNSKERLAYRVYIVSSLDENWGEYDSSCTLPGSNLPILDRVIVLNENSVIPDGQLSLRGYVTLGHELFHAVQYSTPLFRCNDEALGDAANYAYDWLTDPDTDFLEDVADWIDDATPLLEEVGSWITEGQAEAIGWDLAELLRGFTFEPGRLNRRWGMRDYSLRLPVENQGVSLLHDEDDEIRMRAYYTSSFWRFLAEYKALGEPPGPEMNPVDYSYLPPMLQLGPVGRDCHGIGAPCLSELAWLQAVSERGFGRDAREIYAEFVQSFANFHAHRPVLPTLTGADRETQWYDRIFQDGCMPVKLGPHQRDDGLLRSDRVSRDLAYIVNPNGAYCFHLRLEQFDDDGVPLPLVPVAVRVDVPPGAFAINDLTLSIAGRPIRSFRARQDVHPTTEALSATWILELPTDTTSQVVLTNMADNPAATTLMKNLPVTFTVLDEFAAMAAGSGDSNSDPSQVVDVAPLSILLDTNDMAYITGNQNENHDRHGHQDVCSLQFAFSNSVTEDGLFIRMDHEGPIKAGDYPIHNGADGCWSLDYVEANPAVATVNFALGPHSGTTAGYKLNYCGRAGTLSFDYVSPVLVVGTVNVGADIDTLSCYGPDGRRIRSSTDCPGPRSMAAVAHFAALPKSIVTSVPPPPRCFPSEPSPATFETIDTP